TMWKCYISFCLERFKRKTNNEFLRNTRLNKVLHVFEKAHESSLLPQALYKQWVRFIMFSSLIAAFAMINFKLRQVVFISRVIRMGDL
ncbi:hypothetical protein chiPu_0029490, partial [Chiloscyllium punctatum]|nr:hypothetical protein [Chiloscyllium punctatum]